MTARKKRAKLKDSVVLLKLPSGEEVAGILFGEEEGTRNLILSFPMVILNDKETGVLKLDKFLLFSDDHIHSFNRNQIVSLGVVSPEFETYYHNNVRYYNKYEEPTMRATLRSINSAFMNVFSDDNGRFVEAAKAHNVNLKDLEKQRAN